MIVVAIIDLSQRCDPNFVKARLTAQKNAYPNPTDRQRQRAVGFRKQEDPGRSDRRLESAINAFMKARPSAKGWNA